MAKKDQQPKDLPVLHSAVPNQNMFSMTDSEGNRKWLGVGKSVNGYNIRSFDKDGKSVTVEKDGRMHVIGLQGSVPTAYVPPQEPVGMLGSPVSYGMDPSDMVGAGTVSNTAQGALDDEERNSNIFKDQKPISKEMYRKIIDNTTRSPYMTDEDKANIIHPDEYLEKMNQGKLEKNKRYFIPRLFDDGNVDFDIYTHEPTQM